MLTGQLLATGPVYLSLFLPLSPSTLSVCLMCVCTCFKDSILSAVVLHKTDVAYHYLHHDHAFLAPNKSFFSASAA